MSESGQSMKDTMAFVTQMCRAGVLNIDGNSGFTLTSGQSSPVYLDHRLLFGIPSLRREALALWTQLVIRFLPSLNQRSVAVVGTATAGIAPAFGLADALGLPFAYVRTAAKSHGLRRTVEGALHPGDEVVVVDDMVSTGGSALAAADRLREAGHAVALITSFTSREPGESAIRDRQYRFASVFQMGPMLAAARDASLMTEADWEACSAWLDSVSAVPT